MNFRSKSLFGIAIALFFGSIPFISCDLTAIANPPDRQTSERRANYRAINLTAIPANRLSDRDPKLAAIKAFGERESAQPEGLISESLEVSYPGAGKAIAIAIVDGLADDSVRAKKYWIEMQLTGEKWKIVWAGTQVKCRSDRGHSDWSSKLCS